MHILVYGFSGKILGGIETFILNMNEHMSCDCIFDYIIDGDSCVYSERIKQRGGSIHFVPGVKRHPLGYVSKFRKILKEQKEKGTNVLYVQLFSMANMLPALLAKWLGYKVILHAHNNGLQNKNRFYKLIHDFGKALTKHMNFIRFTNSSLSSDFMFGKGMQSDLIYNAIDDSKFSFSLEIRKKVRAEQGCGNKTVVGFVGRFMLQKNPVFMIQVFAEFLKKQPNSELWIVGEGELKEAMHQEVERLGIESAVKWLGRRNDVEQMMQGMDLLLQPSLFEGLGIVLIEAQATGLPVVTSAEVVPHEAKATDCIRFQKLNTIPTEWADACIEMTNFKVNRTKVDFPNCFKIDKEARRLEILISNA